MNYIIALIVLALLIAGGWYLYTNSAAEDDMDANMDETHDMDGMDMSETQNGDDVSAGSQLDLSDGTANEVTVDVSGTNHSFSASEIRVDAGDTVTVNFMSNGGFHDFVLDEFDAATERVNEGGTTSVTFVADEVGTYEYYCSVGNHRAMGMVGNLIVE